MNQNLFIANVLKVAGGAGLAQVITFLGLPLLARLYSPEEIGLYSSFISLLAILGVVVALRYELAIAIPEDDEKGRQILGLSLVIVAVFSSLALFAGMVIEYTAATGYEEFVPAGSVTTLFSLCLFSSGCLLAFNYWSIRKGDFSTPPKARIAQALSALVGQLSLYKIGIAGLLTAYLGSLLFSLFVYAKKYRISALGIPGTFSGIRMSAREFASFPKYSAPAGLINAMGSNMPTILLLVMMDAASAGLFALVHRLYIGGSSILGNAVSNVFVNLAPLAFRAGKLSLIVYEVQHNLVLLAVGFSAASTIFAILFLEPVLGQQWDGAKSLGMMFGVLSFAILVTSPLSTVFVVSGKQKQALALQALLLVMRIAPIIVLASSSNLLFVSGSYVLGSMLGYFVFLYFAMRASAVDVALAARSMLNQVVIGVLVFSPAYITLATIESIFVTLLVTSICFVFYAFHVKRNFKKMSLD